MNHLIGSPLVLASEEFAAKAWKKYEDLPALQAPETNFTHGRVTNVDCEKRVAVIINILTGESSEQLYDYLVVNTGVRRHWPTVPSSFEEERILGGRNGTLSSS